MRYGAHGAHHQLTPPPKPKAARKATPIEGRRTCPMGGECLPCCQWRIGEQCAMVVLAQQAARQGNELYAIVEIMQGGRAEPTQLVASEGGAQAPTSDRGQPEGLPQARTRAPAERGAGDGEEGGAG